MPFPHAPVCLPGHFTHCVVIMCKLGPVRGLAKPADDSVQVHAASAEGDRSLRRSGIRLRNRRLVKHPGLGSLDHNTGLPGPVAVHGWHEKRVPISHMFREKKGIGTVHLGYTVHRKHEARRWSCHRRKDRTVYPAGCFLTGWPLPGGSRRERTGTRLDSSRQRQCRHSSSCHGRPGPTLSESSGSAFAVRPNVPAPPHLEIARGIPKIITIHGEHDPTGTA